MKNAGVDESRRGFIGTTIKLTALSGIAILSGFKADDEDKKVSPPEDLMQEHGLLNRVLLIYDHCRQQLETKRKFPAMALASAADVIRKFVEDYHEKQEENYLFPRFRKANRMTNPVQTL